jgi:hypothetical protein
MDKTPNKSTDQKYPRTDRSNLFIGGIIVFFVASTPFLFYSYESLPKTRFWETFLFGTITTNYDNIYTLAWYLVSKVIPLSLFLLWFFTCKHWWHWIILVPISMYSFQLWGIVNESNSLDVLEIYYIIPLLIVLVPAVYLMTSNLLKRIFW